MTMKSDISPDNLRQRMLLHTTYRMFLFSLFLIIISLLITCIAYGKFVDTGYEDYELKVIGINTL